MVSMRIFVMCLVLLLILLIFSGCSDNFRKVDSRKETYRLLLINKENGRVEYSNPRSFEIDVEAGSLEFTDRKLNVNKYKIRFEKVH